MISFLVYLRVLIFLNLTIRHETHNYHNTIHETGVFKFYTQLLKGVGYVYLIHE